MTGKPLWPAAAVERLRELWTRGSSAGQIAADLGLTRNAVMGKITRLGLHRAPKAPAQPWVAAGVSERSWYRQKQKTHQRPPQGQRGPTYVRRDGTHIEAAPFGPELIALPVNNEPGKPVTLLQLREHHCRYPHEVAGQPMMYCGARALPSLPYCQKHQNITHQPARWHLRRLKWASDVRGS